MGKAKRGGVFGLIRGSVGPATYSIGKDGAGKKQQIIREKPVEVANPRTRAQALQRMKLVPISYAMRLLDDIVNHSFVGVQEGWPSRRHFMALAMKENDIPFIAKGSLNRNIGGYVISEGTVGTISPKNAVSQNVSIASYGKSLPGILLFKGNDEYGRFASGNVSWADLSANLIAASNGLLQDGDEIAMLSFITANAGGAEGIRLEKRRMLLDTNFTTETPDDYKFTSGDNTFDLNVLYAFDQYNPDINTSALKSLAYAQLSLSTVVGFNTFQLLMGLLNDGGETDVDYLTWLVRPWLTTDGASIQSSAFVNSVPQNATEAANSGKLAAAACIISRRNGDAWNYTISDICLTKGYLELVNSTTRLEAAINSYMSDTVVATSSSELYLQLTSEQYESMDVSYVNVTGNVVVTEGEDAVAVKAELHCRIDPNTGKFIVFVDNNGYVTAEGIDYDNSLAFRGQRWKLASNNTYTQVYVKQSDISDTSNIIFAQEVF